MNYERIYNEFISDRKTKPKPHGYVERHHIIPKYFGGGDDDFNLIYLTPEDHFFAHLCWAMIHKDKSSWAAVMIMHERGNRGDIFKRKSRERYAFARRNYSEICKAAYRGTGNPAYKSDLVTFKNKDGRLESNTRLIWVKKHGMSHAALRGVMTGKSQTYLGWMLPETNARKTGLLYSSHKRFPEKVNRWVHFDGRNELLGHRAMANKYGLRISDLLAVIRGDNGICKGWSIAGRKVGWDCGRKNFTDDNVYCFKHVCGKVVKATRVEMVKISGIDPREVAAIASKERKSAAGWMLNEVANTGYIPRMWKQINGEWSFNP